MSFKIVDASVAVKWFALHEFGRDEAFLVLDQIKKEPEYFAVPDLFYCEMLAVLCKIFADAQEVSHHLEDVLGLGMRLFNTGKTTLSTAAEIAKKYELSGYDAIYAANAKLTGGTWITADERAHRKIQKLQLSRLLIR